MGAGQFEPVVDMGCEARNGSAADLGIQSIEPREITRAMAISLGLAINENIVEEDGRE